MKLKLSVFISYLTLIFIVSGCADINYIKSEISGSAKPAGGISKTVPAKKTFPVNRQKLRTAVLSVLDSQGYIYEENPSTGTIKTEAQPLSGQRESGIMGATYSAKLFIKIVGSSVTYNARFNKESNLTMGGQNLKFPEKENALRKEFFDKVTIELGLSGGPSFRKDSQAQLRSKKGDPKVKQVQLVLTNYGYNPGPVDGLMGSNTRVALKNFQRDNQLPQTSKMDEATLAALGIKGTVPVRTVSKEKSQDAATLHSSEKSGQSHGSNTIDTETSKGSDKNKSQTSSSVDILGPGIINQATQMYDKPSVMGGKLSSVPKGTKVTLITKEKEFYKVSFKGQEGYIYNIFVNKK